MPWPKGKKFSDEHIAKRSASLVSSGKKRKKPVILDGVEHWKCGTCKVFKPALDFYEDGKTVSGVSSVCKVCHCESSIRTRDPENARAANVEYMRRARKAHPEKFREREREASRHRRQNDPLKVSARSALNNAVKRGDVVKPSHCEHCGRNVRLTGHHHDYSKPLDVIWLCYLCHGKEHRVVEFKQVESYPSNIPVVVK